MNKSALLQQEFNLAPHLTVRANLTLGREQPIAGFILRESVLGVDQSRRCREALAMLGVDIPLDVDTLTPEIVMQMAVAA